MPINTGMPRSVIGHAISGGFIAMLVAGIDNKARFDNKQGAFKHVAKVGLQGAAISAAAIAATNSIGSKPAMRAGLEALGYLAAGAAVAVALEAIIPEEPTPQACLPKE
ncbi:MAG: hypothetical protein K2O85_05435 [Helicobacter sp.]|nr:hypothetical protein [Helicobacter sp.]